MALVLALLVLTALALVGLRLYHRRAAAQRAETLYSSGDLEGARTLFLTLGEQARAEDCDEQLRRRALRESYQAAEKLLNGGDFLGAKEAFLALGDFEDAPERAVECDYRRAESYAAADRQAEAISLLETLGDYPGARELITRCRDALYDRVLEATYA